MNCLRSASAQRVSLVLILLFGLGAVPRDLTAETLIREDPRLKDAWSSFEKRGIQLVGVEGQRQLVDAAFASVAASACRGLTFHPERVDSTFSLLVDQRGPKTAPERQRFTVQLSTLYGAYLGLLLSESALAPVPFCAAAHRLKRHQGGPSAFWSPS